jgi:hypothetical protein
MHKYTLYYGDDKEKTKKKKDRENQRKIIAAMTTQANFDSFYYKNVVIS